MSPVTLTHHGVELAIAAQPECNAVVIHCPSHADLGRIHVRPSPDGYTLTAGHGRDLDAMLTSIATALDCASAYYKSKIEEQQAMRTRQRTQEAAVGEFMNEAARRAAGSPQTK